MAKELKRQTITFKQLAYSGGRWFWRRPGFRDVKKVWQLAKKAYRCHGRC